MEESKNKTEPTNTNIDNLVNNYIDDIFNNASGKLQQEDSQKNIDLENYTKNFVDDIFKTSLDNVKEIKKKKKKSKNKNKNKTFRLKTLTIDAKIDVIDEEDSDEAHEEKKKIKNENENKNKIKKHSKSNSMDFIPENYIHKINKRKDIKKLQLIRPPSSIESNDDFYLSKIINNKKNGNNYDDLCILF